MPSFLTFLVPAALTSLFVFLIGYLLATVIGVEQLKAYTKVEMSNLLFSVIIVFVVIAAFKGVIFASEKIAGTKVDPIHYTLRYMTRTIYESLIPLYADIITQRVLADYFAAHVVNFGPGPWGHVISAWPTATAVKEVLTGVSFVFSMFYATLMIQELGLALVPVVMPLLFGLGCVAYVVPPFKSAGAYLISLSLGFWVVFPTVCTLSYISLDHISMMLYHHPYTYFLTESTMLKYGSWLMWAHVFQYGIAKPLGIFLIAAPYATRMILGILDLMSQLSVIALFIPSLAMLVTIAFISAGVNVLTGKVT